MAHSCNLLCVVLASMVGAGSTSTLQAQMESYITAVSAEWGGVGIGVGYIDAQAQLDFGIAAGSSGTSTNTAFTANDTVVLGSGTKPYVAATVMRLVDAGKVSLEDKAAAHIDAVMQRLWNTSFVELLGDPAKDVTVGHLLRMKSGLADMDVEPYESWVLLNESLQHPSRRHDPLEDLTFVANLNPPSSGGPSRICAATEGKCTWLFTPGTHSMYTSTNFLLAGLVVLAHAPAGQDGWATLDPAALLLPDGSSSSSAAFHSTFPHTSFPGVGALNTVGLSSVGSCTSTVAAGANVTNIYRQDASIMGWCYGNTVSSAQDAARFYYKLLGTDDIVSPVSPTTTNRHRHTNPSPFICRVLFWGS